MDEYEARFGMLPSIPMSVDEPIMVEVWRAALAADVPVPEDNDWWASLPPGAVA